MTGFITQIYKINFSVGLQDATIKMDNIIRSAIYSDIGGENQKIRNKQTQYNDLMFKLLLLQIRRSVFQLKGKLYQFVVNGRTGDVIGDYPKSTAKIVTLVVSIILALIVLSLIIQ